MGKDHGRRIVGERLPHDLARMNARAVDRAAEQLVERDQAMATVEVQAAEDLVGAIAQLGDEEGGGVLGRLEQRT